MELNHNIYCRRAAVCGAENGQSVVCGRCWLLKDRHAFVCTTVDSRRFWRCRPKTLHGGQMRGDFRPRG